MNRCTVIDRLTDEYGIKPENLIQREKAIIGLCTGEFLENEEQALSLGAVRRSYSYEELAEHWKFCGNIYQMIKEQNEKANSTTEREATKFAGECVVTIMDDLQSLLDG